MLFVCDSFSVIKTEMPFRDPRVWEGFGMPFNDRDASFEVQIVAKHLGGYTNNLMVPLTLDYPVPADVSDKFGLTVADEMLTKERKREILDTGWRHRNKATGLTKPDASGQPIIATRPPAVPQLPPLRFPSESAAGDPDKEEEEKHDTREEQWEVDRFYAPAAKCWYLTKGDETITIEQYATTADGSEMTKRDYVLWVMTSYVGWRDSSGRRVQYSTAYDGIAEGKKRDAWNAKYRKRVDEMLGEQIFKDRQELRSRRRAVVVLSSE